MKPKWRWMALLPFLTATLPAADPAGLALAELSFSFYTQEHGIRDGFLKYLARDGMVFRPAVTPARPVYEKAKPGGGKLAWRPQEVVVASSDDLGMSWGPFTFTVAGAPTSHGHYFSVWRREAGAWRLFLDLGVSHPPVDIPVPDWSVPLERPDEQPLLTDAAFALEKERLLARESSLVLDAGDPAPFLAQLDPRVVLLRDGVAPIRGTAGYEVPKGGRTWKPLGGELSRAGDLAVCYGEASDGASAGKVPTRRCSYVHVWRRTAGRWRLIAEATLPLPPAERGSVGAAGK